ncbi:MAG: alpha/beta hydrolase family protein [Alphaproteobacteria bacterium]|nr:hypothetical protein [Rhodospirillaceae bacterium]MDP6406657.1 alpha/beta hydrolase family protein [Alphaproteobacteria bacterium]
MEIDIRRFLAGPVGVVATWRWLDRLTITALKHIFFPSSRLWASAETADLDSALFCADLGLQLGSRQMRRLDRVLAQTAERRARAQRVDEAWEAVFFGGREASQAARAKLEVERLRLRHDYNSARALFRFLLLEDVPLVKRRRVEPRDVEAVFGHAVDDPVALFRPDRVAPEVSRSQAIEIAGTRQYWLRFTSPYPRLADQVYARVYEPIGVENPPTVVLGHGICVEFDHWKGLLDEASVLCSQGMRVVRCEAPYHGRRRQIGYYGGERVIADSPLSSLDTFIGAVRERAVLIDWCRRQGAGPVAIGGSSLGAMMALLTVESSHDWPAALRPDGLIMITQCERPIEGLLGGSIAKMFRSEETNRTAGWNDALMQRYLGILEPKRGPVMPAERIVSILGQYDTATPFLSGRALLSRWQVPEENTFIWPCGHFTVPIRLSRDPAPLRRFAGLMAQAA